LISGACRGTQRSDRRHPAVKERMCTARRLSEAAAPLAAAAWGSGRGHHHRGWGRSNELVWAGVRGPPATSCTPPAVAPAGVSRQLLRVLDSSRRRRGGRPDRRRVRKRPGVMARELWRETARPDTTTTRACVMHDYCEVPCMFHLCELQVRTASGQWGRTYMYV
jgi:hypothetical protein